MTKFHSMFMPMIMVWKNPCKPATESETTAVTDLQNCPMSVKEWMDENHLKMNNGKTEVIIFGSRQQVSNSTMKSVCINGKNIEISDCIKYLGVWADQHLTFKYHIKMKCKMATHWPWVP